jgi:hypothetical protein
LYDQWIIEEIREEIQKVLEFNENENTTVIFGIEQKAC